MRRQLFTLAVMNGALATATALPAQRAPVAFEPVGRWGCLECTSGHQFGEIAGIAVAPDGRMYVLDRDEPRVRVFDASGRLMLGFGRRGQGPGELEAPFAVDVLPDSSFRVVDIRTSRITHYGPKAQVLGTFPMRNAMPTAASPNRVTGGLHVATMNFRERTGTVERWEAGVAEGVVVIASTEGFPPSEGIPGTVDAMAVSPTGVVAIGDGRNEYRIRRYGADGRVLSPDIVRTIEKTPRTPEEMDEVRARLARAGSQMRAAMEQQRAGSGTSVAMPEPYAMRNHFGTGALQYDDAGRLWVRTERGGPRRTIFDLFDPGGRYIGEAELPVKVGDFDIAGAYLAAALRGTDDIPGIALWTIRMP